MGVLMKIQKIDIGKNKHRYLLIDDDLLVVEPVKKYLKFLDNLNRSENTLKNYAFHLKLYFEYLQEIGISYNQISEAGNNPIEILGNFVSWLDNPTIANPKISYFTYPESKRCNKTINIITTTVLGFYDFISHSEELPNIYAYKEQRRNPKFKGLLYELIPNSNIIRKNILHRKAVNKESKALTREQYESLLSHCNSDRDKSIIAIMFEGGLRLGETLGLHIEDIEPYNNRIYIKPRNGLENGVSVKNHSQGDVYVPPYVMRYITNYIIEELTDLDTNYLFVNLHGENKGKPMKPITVQKLFERLSKDIDVKVNPHMCRHGHGTELAEAGWDLVEIKDRLRHKSVQSTTVYTHLSDIYKKEKLNELHRMIKERKDDNEFN